MKRWKCSTTCHIFDSCSGVFELPPVGHMLSINTHRNLSILHRIVTCSSAMHIDSKQSVGFLRQWIVNASSRPRVLVSDFEALGNAYKVLEINALSKLSEAISVLRARTITFWGPNHALTCCTTIFRFIPFDVMSFAVNPVICVNDSHHVWHSYNRVVHLALVCLDLRWLTNMVLDRCGMATPCCCNYSCSLNIDRYNDVRHSKHLAEQWMKICGISDVLLTFWTGISSFYSTVCSTTDESSSLNLLSPFYRKRRYILPTE